jgi:hypothetical protein
MIFKVVDVTSITGHLMTGPLTSWQTRNGPYNVEHLAGMNRDGDLIVFWWSPRHDWQSVNVSQITGPKIASPVTSWQTPNGPFLVEHLAGTSPQGDLLVFWWSPQHDWQALDVTAKTGQRVSGALTSWQTPNGPYNVEHLAGMTPDGDLAVFWWSPRHDWQSVNVSQKVGGQRISGSPASWQTQKPHFLAEYLSCQGPSNSLLVFWWSPRYDWQLINNTPIIRRQVTSPQTAWQSKSGPFTIDHLASVDGEGRLLVFWHSTQWERPWTALMVKFKDDPPNAATDPPTPLDVFYKFFTSKGVDTYNAVRYFSQMSHGNVDPSGSRIIFVTLNANYGDYVPPSDPPPANWHPQYDEYGVLELARQAAKDAGELLDMFVVDVLTSDHGIFPPMAVSAFQMLPTQIADLRTATTGMCNTTAPNRSAMKWGTVSALPTRAQTTLMSTLSIVSVIPSTTGILGTR